MAENLESDELCEYAAPVTWKASVASKHAKWKTKAGLYTTTHVRASLDGQPKTIAFLEQAFTVDIKALMI